MLINDGGIEMRVTVFGATGRTGRLFIKKALLKGHEVVAFARSPEKITFQHERLTIIKGTLSDIDAIEKAVKDTDAVIELIGAVSEGTANIVAAMQKHNVRRLIALSAISHQDALDKRDFQRGLINGIVKLTMPKLVKEVSKAAAIIRESGLDWTLVRVPSLKDNGSSSYVKVGSYGRGEVGFQLSRADLSQFMYEQLTDQKYIRQAPAISS